MKNNTVNSIKKRLSNKILYFFFIIFFSITIMIFFILFAITQSLEKQNEVNLQEHFSSLVNEIENYHQITSMFASDIFTADLTLKDLKILQGTSIEEYFLLKNELYMSQENSQYNGVSNLAKKYFETNRSLSEIIFFNQESNSVVHIKNNLKIDRYDNLDDTLKKTKEYSQYIVTNRTIYNPENLTYLTSIYLVFNFKPIYDQYNSRIQRDNGKLIISNNENINITKNPKNLFHYKNEGYNFSLIKIYRSVFTEFYKYYLFFFISSIFSALVISILIYKKINVIQDRLDLMLQNMKNIQKGDFSKTFFEPAYLNKNDELSLLNKEIEALRLAFHYNMNQVLQSEKRVRLYELKTIRSQINPHFLYNTLEVIRMRALLNGDTEVSDLIFNTSMIYRTMVKLEEDITLKEEIEFCDSYLNLFSIRFENKLFYDIDLPSGLENKRIEKFSIQPIIENYIHHGIDLNRQNNFIEIYVYTKNKQLIVEAKNNGFKVPDERLDYLKELFNSSKDNLIELKDEELTGLIGVHYRLRHRFGNQYGVSIENEDELVCIQLKMPLRGE